MLPDQKRRTARAMSSFMKRLKKIAFVLCAALIFNGLLGFSGALPIPPTYANVITAFSGELKEDNLKFNRPMFPYDDDQELSGESAAYNKLWNGTEAVGVMEEEYAFFTRTLIPAETGLYTISVDPSTTNLPAFDQGWQPNDTCMLLYEGTFNPAFPLQNLIYANEDEDYDGNNWWSQIGNVVLMANTHYVLVVTSYSPQIFGPVGFIINGAGSVNVQANEYSSDEEPPLLYNVTFDSRGGSDVTPLSNVASGSTISAPTAPTLEDYDFDGWYKDEDLEEPWDFVEDTMPGRDITLYAKWTIKTYEVVFADWDGTVLDTQMVSHGGSATAPATSPTKAGHSFSGWNASYDNVTSGLTITAQYSANMYTVSFESNGGSAVESVTASYDETIEAPTAPTLEGLDFDGWYKDEELEHEWNFDEDTVPLDGTTLYAKWTIKTYEVVFADWDGTVLDTQMVSHGGSATAPATSPTKAGHIFSGWNASYDNVTSELTITAQYSANMYTVSFESNGGSAIGPVTASYNETIEAPTAPTLEGYRFDGWYQEVELSNIWVFNTDTVPAHEVTLYAKWTAVYTVIYHGNGNTGGSVPTDNTLYEQGGTVVVLSNTGSLNKVGYTFDGWNTQPDGSATAYAANDTVEIDGADVVLYASWRAVPVIPAPPGTPIAPPDTTSGVDVLVNGKVERAGVATDSKKGNQTVTTVTVDPDALQAKLEQEGDHAVVTIPVNSQADVVVGELNGQMIRNMEQKQAVIEIRTANAAYTLPAQQINIELLAMQLGQQIELRDIRIQITIAEPSEAMIEVVRDTATSTGLSLVIPPLDFTVEGIYGDTTVEVTRFDMYVERTIAVPEGVDPSRITTGVVIEPDGTVRHVPTKIVVIDGQYYAKINSLTNSMYSVVWHPLAFGDVEGHWAQEAVNDMGSRMVIHGTGDDTFSPDRDITRAEFVAIIVRGLGLKLEKGTTPFSDVKETAWYSSAIQTAYKYGLINGFADGVFRPDDTITREQAMAIMAKAMAVTGLKAKLPAQSEDESLGLFTDTAAVSAWAKSDVAINVQSGIVAGRSDAQLAPQAFITRAEVAVIVKRLLQKSELI